MTAPQKLEKIGRYQVLERVGKGGMGVLYRGFDPVLDREVAIKLMHADFSEDTEQMRPRFYREARAAAKLNHRNIVTIFEFAEESNVPYIVMEFLRGTPLGARMKAPPPLTLDDKLNVVAQLCDGLSYAHEQGVVHRDVKPDNVFLLEDGSVKLLDFGIAKLHDVDADAPGRRARQRVVHVAGAGRRQRIGRRPGGYLLDRRRAVRAVVGPQAVRRRLADRGHRQDPEGRADADRNRDDRTCRRRSWRR